MPSFSSLLIKRARGVYGGENSPRDPEAPVRSGVSSTAKKTEREQSNSADARAFMERMKARRKAKR